MLRSLWICGIAVMLPWAAVAQADDKAEVRKFQVGPLKVEVHANAKDTSGGPVQVEVEPADPITPSDYWIGLACRPVPGALRAKRELPEGEGILVIEIVPDSPAAKAGIERGDVLLRAGKKPLGSIRDLIDAIDAANGVKLTLKVNRAGKVEKLTVTPEKRLKDVWPDHFVPIPGNADGQNLLELLGRMPSGWAGRGPMRFRFFHPGTILPPDAAVRPPLPENMTVIITRKGAEPAKIEVRQAGEKWKVTENELDELPKKVRRHVERMLGRMPARWSVKVPAPADVPWFDFVPDWAVPGHPDGPAGEWKKVPSLDSLQRRMEQRFEDMKPRFEAMKKRFEAMNRRIEELRESIEGMRERPKDKPPKDEPDRV